jgi:hypothetical protein
MPDNNQITNDAPLENETPFFSLLEDDGLITRVSVETDRLLSPDLVAHGPTRVSLVIGVTLKAAGLSFANMELVS